jgi:hypothetical protein
LHKATVELLKKGDQVAPTNWRRSTAGSPHGFDTLDLKEAKALLDELPS